MNAAHVVTVVRPILAAMLALATAFAAAAGPLELVADINRTVLLKPDADHAPFGSGELVTLCGDTGCRPFFLDASGLRHLGPLDYGITGVMGYGVVGSSAYFISSWQGWLWRTDGTAAGTRQITEDGFHGPIGRVGNNVMFTSYPYQVAMSNGTEYGTGGLPFAPFNREALNFVVPFGERTFFTTEDYHPELFITDGITAPKSLRSFSGAYYMQSIGVTGDRFYFWEFLNGGSRTIWSSDGTAANTVTITSENPDKTALLNGSLYFVTNSGATPAVARSLLAGGFSTVISFPYISAQVAATNNAVFFVVAGPGVSQLWKTNGTAAGSSMVREFTNSSIQELVGAPDSVYFTLVQNTAASNWRSDGTSAGTASFYNGSPALTARAYMAGQMLLATEGDVAYTWKPGQGQPLPLLAPFGGASRDGLCGSSHATFRGKAYFLANDGIHGCELWQTDGTAAGTRMIVDAAPGAADGSAYLSIDFTASDETLFFALQQPDGSRTLWSTDGQDAVRLAIPQGSHALRAVVNGRLLYGGNGTMKSYDPSTLQSTTISTDIFAVNDGTSRSDSVRIGEQHYFLSQKALSKSDGTAAGTSIVVSFPAGQDGQGVFKVGNRLVLVVEGSLWVSDGTPEGTVPLGGPIAAGAIRWPLDVVNGALVVSATDGLWRTDGTVAGTTRFSTQVQADQYSPRATDGKRVYFIQDQFLVVTDGTAAGTLALGGPRIETSSYFHANPSFTIVDGTLYFMGSGELWQSTGTRQGTRLVHEWDGYDGAPVAEDDHRKNILAALPSGLLALTGLSADGGLEPQLVRSDRTPDAFTYSPATNVPTRGWAVSQAVTLQGINVRVPVNVSGGEACVSSEQRCTCDLAAFAPNVEAVQGDSICVRLLAPSSPNTTATATVQAGGFSTSFNATTWSAAADAISFGPEQIVVLEQGTFTIPVYRTGSGAGAASARWTTASGSASAGSDYGSSGDSTEITGVLEWADGDLAPKTITLGAGGAVAIANDGIVEPLETFRILLSEVVGATLSPFAESTVAIDSTNARIEFEASVVTFFPSGNSTVEIGVRRTGSLVAPVSVRFEAVTGTADPSHYSLPADRTVTFAAGQSHAVATFYLRTPNDWAMPEYLTLHLVDPANGASLGPQSSIEVRIDTFQPMVSFTKGHFLVQESGGNALVTLARSGPIDKPLRVDLRTEDGSVTAPSRYTARTGTLTWAAGESGEKTFQVPIVDNAAPASPSENNYFWIAITDVIGGRVDDHHASVAIIDDDNNVQLAAATATVDESAGSIALTVTRSDGCCKALSVQWSVTGGTAAAGADFGPPASGTVSWADYEVGPKSIVIPIVDDDLAEGDETFIVTLSSPVGARLGTVKATTVTIKDNDAGIAFSQPTYTVGEKGASVSVSVTRTGPATAAASVKWSTANGSAIAGQDFGAKGSAVQPGGTLAWSAGQSTPKTISIPILDDSIYEGPELFTIVLRDATGSPLGKPNVTTVTIADDEIPPESSIGFAQSKVNVLENSGVAILTVRRTPIGAGFTVPAAVTYITRAGTAVATSDFSTRSGSITWSAADGADKTISVPIVDNAVAESPESFSVSLATTSPGALIGDGVATVTILDNDEVFPRFGAMPDGWAVPSGATTGWHVSNDAGAYEGALSLRSDQAGDGEKAQVEVTRAFSAGNITFRVKVSSELNFDTLRFFVDGVEKGKWSGTSAWQPVSVPITAGTHTLRWSYEKDSSGSVGFDAAWIDGVVLP